MKKKTLPAKGTRSEMSNLIEIVVRHIISETDFVSSRQAESIAALAVTKAVGEIHQEMDSFSLRLNQIELGLRDLKAKTSKLDISVSETSVTLMNEIHRVEDTVSFNNANNATQSEALMTTLETQVQEARAFAAQAVDQLRLQTETSTASFNEDLKKMQQQHKSMHSSLQFCRERLDSLWSMRPGTAKEVLLHGINRLDNVSLLQAMDERLAELQLQVQMQQMQQMQSASDNQGTRPQGSRSSSSRTRGGSTRRKRIDTIMNDFNASSRLDHNTPTCNEPDDTDSDNKQLELLESTAVMVRECNNELVQWAQHVQSCFGVLSQRVGLPHNLCASLRLKEIV